MGTQTFKQKLDIVCQVENMTATEACIRAKINPFALHLHMTKQRDLSRYELTRLSNCFNVVEDFFTDPTIRVVNPQLLPSIIFEELQKHDKSLGIICYQVPSEDSPDITVYDLQKILDINTQ